MFWLLHPRQCDELLIHHGACVTPAKECSLALAETLVDAAVQQSVHNSSCTRPHVRLRRQPNTGAVHRQHATRHRVGRFRHLAEVQQAGVGSSRVKQCNRAMRLALYAVQSRGCRHEHDPERTHPLRLHGRHRALKVHSGKLQQLPAGRLDSSVR
ncbi:hypothetical protein DQ04_20391000 [Trypanosoma grayi]|uniref:hypothetical protein n=1 Tax=Trypanosoma grayi TaxID=71804 RepID=UPI0004F42A75|nr:hypothetical protein DQ04_20391000 [Trypanosoma grayi]KEG05570.1 hypothetical protein DQ04_20391000 [Trypanosoma grayi]